MERDPQEEISALKAIIDAAERDADKELLGHELRGQMGYCHALWNVQRRILAERHGIDWKSPAEMNPDVLFD